MKRVYIGLITLGVMLSTSSHSEAQRRRTAAAPLDVHKVIVEAETKYREYAFGEALEQVEKAISTLTRQRKAIPQELSELKERIEHVQRLVSRTERLTLLSVEYMLPKDLMSYLKKQIPSLGESIRIELDAGGQIASSDFMSAIGSSGLYAKSSPGAGYDLISAELIEQGNREEEVVEEPISGSVNTHEDENFPYLMPDGITLIFGRLSAQGLGGYDLYMSRYNWRRNTYLEPSMLGMPFNSPSNDYLLIYDDRQDICLLVSDRDCPAGQVAVFKIEGLPRALASQVENSAEVELSPEEALVYARLAQDHSQPSKTTPVSEEAVNPMQERYLLHFGLTELRSSAGQEASERALRLYEELELLRGRQHRMRLSYRQNPSSRAELSPLLNVLEQDIARLLSRYEEEVKLVRKAERP